MSTIPRLLDPAELVEIIYRYALDENDMGATTDEVLMHDLSAHNLTPFQAWVIDDYITDGPGYAGPLYYVQWGGSPEFLDVFTVGPEVVCKICSSTERRCKWRETKTHEFDPEHVRLANRLNLVLRGSDIPDCASCAGAPVRF